MTPQDSEKKRTKDAYQSDYLWMQEESAGEKLGGYVLIAACAVLAVLITYVLTR